MTYERFFSPAQSSAEGVPRWEEGQGVLPVSLLPTGQHADLPVYTDSSILITGTTGTGKTFLTLAYVRELLRLTPTLKTVFFQIKDDDYSAEFLQPGDKVIAPTAEALPPQGSLFVWNMIRELRLSKEPEVLLLQLSSALFARQLEDVHGRIWAGAARDSFAAYLRVILNCYSDCPGNALILQNMRSLSCAELCHFLAKDSANRSLLLDTYGYDPDCPPDPYEPPRTALDTLFYLRDALQQFSGSFDLDGEDTLHDFLRGNGQRLFFQYSLNASELARSFFALFLRQIISEKMSPRSGIAPLLLVLDEIDKLHMDIGLTDALTLGRGFGLSAVVSTQSIEALYGLADSANREHETHAALAGFPVLIAFRGEGYTIKAYQELFGSRMRTLTTLALSRCAPPVVQQIREPQVTDEDFSSLGLGEFYVKCRNADPVRCCLT